jgi:hypothetical protein
MFARRAGTHELVRARETRMTAREDAFLLGVRLRMLSAPYEWLEPYVGFEFEVMPEPRWRSAIASALSIFSFVAPELDRPGRSPGDVRLRAVAAGKGVDVELVPELVAGHFEEIPV